MKQNADKSNRIQLNFSTDNNSRVPESPLGVYISVNSA